MNLLYSLDLLGTAAFAASGALAGVRRFRQLLRATGDTDAALAGYYQGLRSVANRGRLPQTEAYIRNINALRPRFGG